MRHVLRRSALATAAAIASLALAATSAAAPVTGGKTLLRPDRGTVEGLADMGIGIETSGQAGFGSKGAKFPITGGDVDARDPVRGSIEHAGGLVFFTEGGASVKFSKFVIRLRSEGPKLFAKSDGAEVRFLDLDLERAVIGVSERNYQINNADATLAKEGAAVLTETFGFPFEKGIRAGEVNLRAHGQFFQD